MARRAQGRSRGWRFGEGAVAPRIAPTKTGLRFEVADTGLDEPTRDRGENQEPAMRRIHLLAAEDNATNQPIVRGLPEPFDIALKVVGDEAQGAEAA